jgi:GntR family transcriptional regulator
MGADRLGEAKARQVYLVLRDRILSAAIGFGEKLPTENNLARAHGVSRVTVRRALAELARERLIERRPSAGTRVMYRPSPAPITGDIAGVLADLAEMGRRTTVKLLSFGYVPAVGAIADALGVAAGEILQRSLRVRLIDGQPFSYLTTHVPERIGLTYTKAELAAKPLLSLIERSGVKVERARQRISAALATPETAEPLQVNSGSPLIELVRVVYDRHGRGVEHLQALYRPDRYNLEMDLERSGRSSGRTWSPMAKRRPRSNGKTEPITYRRPQ